MEENSKLSELITAFLANELGPDDTQFVTDWINLNEENRKYFEQINNTWKLVLIERALKNVDVDYEWDQFKQALDKMPATEPELEQATAGDIDQDEALPFRKTKVFKILAATAIAAGIIALIFFSTDLFNLNLNQEKSVVRKKNTGSDSIEYFHRVNTSGSEKLFELADGTQVTLSDSSQIMYRDFALLQTRDVTLTGKGLFKIAEDKLKPFTVFSGDISTTALGTEFLVSAYDSTNEITIRLYEGKVVVRSMVTAKKKLPKDYFLTAGDELVYNRKNASVRIKKFIKSESSGKKKVGRDDSWVQENPSVPDLGKGSWFMFNNQPLSEVFDQLETMYNVQIDYTKEDLEKIYFIGTFRRTDSLETIIKNITLLNNLKYIKEEKRIVISR